MTKKQPVRIDEKMTDKPKWANLTNKAGASATPLETDVEAWLKIGWVRVT